MSFTALVLSEKIFQGVKAMGDVDPKYPSNSVQ
jgi:hypothetical protein